MTPTYSGEVQFAGYTDSSKSGPRVTLRLQDRADLEQFVGMEGRRFMLALVEIGADEQPVQKAAPQPAVKRERMGPLCEWAVLRCADEEFRHWARMVFRPDRKEALTPEQCGDVLKSVAGVGSRKDLDTDKSAGALFRDVVMRRYEAWLNSPGAGT